MPNILCLSLAPGLPLGRPTRHAACDRLRAALAHRPPLSALLAAGHARPNACRVSHSRVRCEAAGGPPAAVAAAPPPPPPPAYAPAGPLSQAQFDPMLAELVAWRAKFRTTVVPRSAAAAGGGLAAWAAAVRRLHRRGELPAWAVQRLETAGIEWKVDVLTAKWHANFHAAREFREAHGGAALDASLPPDYAGERADWVEAARWLQRQRELFQGQKLNAYRVWALKEVLGVRLRRPYAPIRKNMHPELVRANAEFKRVWGEGGKGAGGGDGEATEP